MSAASLPQKLPGGVPGLDVLTRGGLPAGRTTLITGKSGAGKSVLSLQIAAHQARSGRTTAYFAVEERPADLELSVSDTGQGITPEFLPYVFDRFRQAKEGDRSGGLGLGLAIVRHLVELHGGEARAESEGAGRGSTFIIRLPGPETRITPPAPERAAGSELAG